MSFSFPASQPVEFLAPTGAQEIIKCVCVRPVRNGLDLPIFLLWAQIQLGHTKESSKSSLTEIMDHS